MAFWSKFTSGLDFWDKKENQQQRDQFAQQDEEDRKRKAQQAASATVVRPNNTPAPMNTPGLTPTNTLVKAGSQSDFSQPNKPTAPIFNLNQPLNKNAPVTTPFAPTPPVKAPVQPAPVVPAPVTPKPVVAQPGAVVQPQPTQVKPTMDPAALRQKAMDYQKPKVQDVNNYYGSDSKVLQDELAKGDQTDWNRVEGLMKSLDNRTKELKTFHDERGNSDSFKTARELGDTIKGTRGDWTKQNDQLKQFWDGVSKNEVSDFNAYLRANGQQPVTQEQVMDMVAGKDAWKNGSGGTYGADFSGDTEKVKEVQQRQQIADAAMKYKDVPLDKLGGYTIQNYLDDFKTQSPEEQRTIMDKLNQHIEDIGDNPSNDKELEKKAQQSYLLKNVLEDSGLQRSNFRTRVQDIGRSTKKIGGSLLESPEHVVQSVGALMGDDPGGDIVKDYQDGKLTDLEYDKKLGDYNKSMAWVPKEGDTKARWLTAIGTSADTVSTFLPVLSAAKGVKGAYVAEKLASQIAIEQGISKAAAKVAAKETLEAFAKNAAEGSLKRTMAEEAIANAGFSGAGSLRSGEFNPEDTLKETVLGGAIGGTAPVVGYGAGKVLSKFRGAETALPEAVEDVGRASGHVEGAIVDDSVRASLVSAETTKKITELEKIVDDQSIPSYQKLEARNQLNTLNAQADEEMAKNLGVGADDALDKPAFIHKQDIEDIVSKHEDALNEHIAQNPELTQAEVESARQSALEGATKEINDLNTSRYSIATTPVNVPSPTSPVALAKAAQDTPTAPGAADDAILPTTFTPAPLQKAEAAAVNDTTAPLQKADSAAVVDAQGNQGMITDAQRAQELAAEGVAPQRGGSAVAAGEQDLQAGAEQAARDQTGLTNPTTGERASNRTAERVLADPNVPVDTKAAITNLTHEVHNDKIMIDSADNLVKNDLNTARQLFDSKDLVSSMNLDGHVHLGNALTGEYNRLGQTAEASLVYNDLIDTTSRLGQGLRAANAISKISPQGIIQFAANVADKNGKRLTPALEDELIQTAKNVAQMEPGAEKAAAIKQMIELAQQPTTWDKAGKFAKGVLSVPRGIMTTGDLSFGLRQGGVLGSRYPAEWAEANARGAKYAVNPKAFEKGMTDLANLKDASGELLAPTFQKMGLSLPAVTGKSEEAFGNTSILESKALKKVGVGHVVAGSDRAFSGTAAELRANVAKKIIDGYGGVAALKDWTTKDFEDLGRVLNTATGRGMGKTGGWFEKAAPTLSDTLFSARLWKSRLDLLNPIYYAKLSPAARKVAMQSSGSFVALTSAVLGAAAAAGADVELDPRSSDFGKIKIGNTRYDIMGGLQQNIVLATRELTGQKKNSITGEVTSFAPGVRIGEDGKPISWGEGEPSFGGATRTKVLGDFVTNKETPVLSTLTRIGTGKDIAGNPVNPWAEIGKLFLPLGVADTYSAAKDSAGEDPMTGGDVVKGAIKAAPGFIGAGVQTYGGDQVKVQAGSGVDPLTLDPKQLKKYQTNTENQFEKGLSKDEQRLWGISQDKKLSKFALEKGEVTQDQLDSVTAKHNDALKKAGLPTDDVQLPSKEATQAHIENGEYDDAITNIDQQIEANKKDKNVPKSKTAELETQKKQLQITKAGNYSPDIIKLYSSTSNSDWRAMTDPDSDEYDPETAGKLMEYDQALTDGSVSGGKKPDVTKFYPKGTGRDGSSGKKMSTDIAVNKQSFDGFTPIKAQGATQEAPSSSIPALQKVANYSRQLKKISTSKGGF